MRANPFYELYLGDSLSAKDFVTLFSPFLIPHAQQIFLPGNVLVVGMQGAGKSMLLSLLKWQTRRKYLEADSEFPVPVSLRKFISCSVNLTHSNAIDFGNRRWSDFEPTSLEILFGDFVNSLLAASLVSSVRALSNAHATLLSETGSSADAKRHAAFAAECGKLTSWSEWIGSVGTLDELEERLTARVREYRGYLHHRQSALSAHLMETRVPLGDPLVEMVDILRSTGVISTETNVFADIDQYEELANVKPPQTQEREVDYRAVINRALSRRDPRISYRIGSRRHSWFQHGRVMGSMGGIENERDYKFVDLDEMLRKSENSRTYLFPAFAEDVFARRLRATAVEAEAGTSLEAVYGKSYKPEEKARLYNPNTPERAVRIEDSWRRETRERLTLLVKNEPLSARLGEAWILQKGENFRLDVRNGELPWESSTANYWKKERIELALLQIASRNQQRVIYSEREEISELSSGNILVFISINQHIWNQYLRYEAISGSAKKKGMIPTIGVDLQTTGVFLASQYWTEKIAEATGKSDERMRFVRELARVARERVGADRKLSYPGATGFSLRNDELDQFPWLREFLGELSDYGNLVEVAHTTKEKSKHSRTKWYLSPILCPHFRVPYARTKEPYYAKITEVFGWLRSAKIFSSKVGVEGGEKSGISSQASFLE